MKHIALFALPVLLLASSGARADDRIDCKSQSLNQMQLDQCAGMDFQKSDAKLNALYKTLMTKYDAPNGALLKSAEKAWLAYRDAECAYETNLTVGGTINPMMDTMCRTTKTDARVKELNAQLHCEEGDLSCNMPLK
ncbi:MAG TPA: lysozyme inhibitor LprI family protein [Rhizomicrobium sp.]